MIGVWYTSPERSLLFKWYFCLSCTFPKRVVLICSKFHPIIRMKCVLKGKLKTCICIAPNVRDLFDGKSHIFGCRIVCQVEFSSRCLAERKTWNFRLLIDKERKNVINTLDVHRSPGLHHSYMRTWCSNLQHECKLTDKVLLQDEPPLSNIVAAIQQQSHIDWAIWNKVTFTVLACHGILTI